VKPGLNSFLDLKSFSGIRSFLVLGRIRPMSLRPKELHPTFVARLNAPFNDLVIAITNTRLKRAYAWVNGVL